MLGESSRRRFDAEQDESIRACYRLVAGACRRAGLSPADADDLAQDLLEWRIRSGIPMSGIPTPWLKRVVHNYILRFRRRSYRRDRLEGLHLDDAPEPATFQPEEVIESNELLDRVIVLLPDRQRDLLALIRVGCSLPEASKLLGIPRGSRAYYRDQLVARARRTMKRDAVNTAPADRAGEPAGIRVSLATRAFVPESAESGTN